MAQFTMAPYLTENVREIGRLRQRRRALFAAKDFFHAGGSPVRWTAEEAALLGTGADDWTLVLMWRLFLSCRFRNIDIRVVLQSALSEGQKAMLKAHGKVAI